MIPLLLLGSFALVIISLPVPGYQDFMGRCLGPRWKNVFLYIRDGTNNIFSIVLVLCIAYSYAVDYWARREAYGSPIVASVVALGSFVALSGMSNPGFSLDAFGVLGVFVAMVTAIASSCLFLRLMSLRRLQLSVFSAGGDAMLNQTVRAIVPAAITVSCFAALNLLLNAAFGIADMQGAFSHGVQGLFAGIHSDFWNGVVYIVVSHIAWFLGIHGGNLVEPVAQSMYAPALRANQAALVLGQAPAEIFTKTFFDTFVLMGGCGATLCLALAIWLTGKDRGQRRIANISLVPLVFNINELIVFGIPIVLNPVFLIPFLATPVVLTLTSYFAAYYALVPHTVVEVAWTTPVFLGGCIATGSWRGGLLQAFNLCLGTLLYVPFVAMSKRAADARTRGELESVCSIFKANEECGAESALLSRMDECGNVARLLVADLDRDLDENRVGVFYQPQVGYDGKLFGVESLLRWERGDGRSIYPPLVVGLAQEAGIIDKLGYYILERACSDMERLNELCGSRLVNSVNISAVQLLDEGFVENVKGTLARHRLDPSELEIEVTEQLALARGDRIVGRLRELKESGVRLAMDDFGMGHTSLMYLKEYEFDTVKLDGSLVHELMSNPACRNIVSTIVGLGETMHYSVIAEFVEREEQRAVLHGLGCDRYQGYLYGKAMPLDELVRYIEASEASAIA